MALVYTNDRNYYYDDVTGAPIIQNDAGYWYADGRGQYVPDPSATPTSSQSNEGYVVRGDYRLNPATTEVQQRIRTGEWAPMDWASEFYDPRQDSNTLDSNERRQLVYWFNNAPQDVPITQSLSWAANNGFQEPDRSGGGGFGDLLPIIALVGIGIATGGFGMFGAGAGASTGAASSLAAADAMAGIGAMEFGASSGLLGTIGTNAAIGAGKSLVTGGDPLEGAFLGGIGGAISGSGVLGDISGGLIDATGATGTVANAITKGVNAAATGAVGSLANGGSFSDVLQGAAVGGLTSGVGNYVSGTVLPGANNTVAGAAGGAASGLIQSALTGGNVGNAVLTGAGAGAAGGLAADAGLGPVTSGAIGAVAGGLIGSSVRPDPVIRPTPMIPAAASTTQVIGNAMSFSDVLPQFIQRPRANMAWGTRLSGG